MSIDLFANQGFMIINSLIDETSITLLDSTLTQLEMQRVGTRHLLEHACCNELGHTIKNHSSITPLLPSDSVIVQCTFFEKSRDQNWLVSVHQDLSIPVKEKVHHPELNGWSEKEGKLFVQPPDSVLQDIVAVRLHLDNCGPNDGPLRVVPASHKAGRLSSHETLAARDQLAAVICPVEKGGALLMKPLLLHASSKASGQSRRRVLHFVFGPRSLPFGLRWQNIA